MGSFFEVPDPSATADGSDNGKNKPEGLRYFPFKKAVKSASCF